MAFGKQKYESWDQSAEGTEIEMLNPHRGEGKERGEGELPPVGQDKPSCKMQFDVFDFNHL